MAETLVVAKASDSIVVVEQVPASLQIMASGVVIGSTTASVIASEALSAGDLVNVWNSAGAFNVRKASADLEGKEAHGFVLADVAALESATVFFEGANTRMTGLAPGNQFLSAVTPGKTSASPAVGTGKVVQTVGFAISATAMKFKSGPLVVLA